MALRCLLFSSDEEIVPPICKALGALGIVAEHCAVAVEAVGKVTTESFHIVIVDWDNQPEAGLLLSTARQRKAAERPLTLAVVSNDVNVPQALQSGANSILRKPIQPNQVRDTLTTARDLLRSRLDSAGPATNAAAAAAAAQSSPVTALRSNDNPSAKKTLRGGEFLHAATGPGAQFDIESDTKNPFGHVTASEIDALKELEPMAASVESKEAAAPIPASLAEPRGLSWYLNARAGTLPTGEVQPAATPQAELLSYSQTPAHNEVLPANVSTIAAGASSVQRSHESDQKTEADLFAYMSGESSEGSEPTRTKASLWLRKALIPVVVVAVVGVAFVTVPRSFWRQKGRSVLSFVAHAGHNLLNPQSPTPAQAPATHENFGRAGDEYKLPVAENIPDATTDPSQIRIVPVLDPTAKVDPNAKQTIAADNTDQAAADTPADGGNAGDQQAPLVQVQENSPAQPPSNNSSTDQPVGTPSQAPATNTMGEPSHPDAVPAQIVEPAPRTRVQSVYQKNPTPRTVSTATLGGIPSSLKSQMASITPEASGNKPPEAALPSIEPVQLPEAAARSLLLQQPEPVYPETAKGQKGTVVLQVLIGRDGTVQDAKFLQGSLAFARAAIDAVKQWRFKPFTMNGHPASTQTLLTLNFKPTT